MSFYSTENIKGQNPSFFKDLTQIFTDIEKALPETHANEPLGDYLQNVSFALNQSRYTKQLQDCIHHHTGVPVKDVHFDPTPHLGASIDYDITVMIRPKNPIADYAAFNKVVSQLSGHVNQDTGYVDNTTLLNNTRSTIVLFSSLVALYKFYPDTYLEPAEIAAIVLHELGHLYHYLGGYQNDHTYLGLSDQLRLFQPVDLTDKEAVQIITACVTLLKESAKKKTASKEFQTDLSQLIKELPSKHYSTAQLLSVIQYVTRCTSLLLGVTVLDTRGDDIGRPGVRRTAEQKTEEERGADTYAARCGAAAALDKALHTLRRSDRRYGGELNPDVARLPRVVQSTKNQITRYDLFASFFDVSACVSDDQYDPEIKRHTELLNSLLPIFKERTLSKAMRDYYIGEVTSLKEQLRTMLSRTDIKYRSKIFNGLKILRKYGLAPFNLFVVDLDEEYARLQTTTRSLVDNPLFYQAARLDKILETIDS